VDLRGCLAVEKEGQSGQGRREGRKWMAMEEVRDRRMERKGSG